MEYFAHARLHTSPQRLQEQLVLEALPRFCVSIEKLLETGPDHARVWCLWGEFRVRRECIRDGVRFTLPDCPNALAWTITAEADSARALVHLAINRSRPEEDFDASIRTFMNDWVQGLEAGRERLQA
ncbi:MAG TPA: hypothetical protein ENJ79_05715 [Gammaproteobacteria bacterium]|nr:hypothetical protein [Gammaproteobacteria bacterium]